MSRSFSIAWRGLLYHRVRTVAVTFGVGFSVLFIFLELGFLGAVERSATAVSDRLAGELLLVSQRFVHLDRSDAIPRSRLAFAASDPEVESVVPIYVNLAWWRRPGGDVRAAVITLGLRLDDPPPMWLPELDSEMKAALRSPSAFMIGRIGQPKLGPTEVGTEVELSDRPSRIAGQLDLGVGVLADGVIVISDLGYARLFPETSLSEVSAGVIRLAPGADPERVAARLRTRLPGDTRVLTRSELRAGQIRTWVIDTSSGNIFGAGAVVAFLVGLVVLYQALSTDIIQQKAHYATLKAIGYEDRQLGRVVLEQSVLYAFFGAVPAFLMALALYALIRVATRLPVDMTIARAIFVGLFTLAMAVGSGRLALSKITRADPADLF